jgi:hypothetical protein
MDMTLMLIRTTTWVFLVGLVLVVMYQILTGKIELKGLLQNGRDLSVNRVQWLMVTMLGALYYFFQTLANPTELPDLPRELLFIQGGSGLIYLIGQYRSIPK